MEALTTCPICDRDETVAIRQMLFGEKPYLPTVVTLRFCADCDFAFTSPRNAEGYRAYYASVANDLSQRHGQYQNTQQVEIITDLITRNDVRSILDFGCGGGGLVHALAARFPEVTILGFDVNADFPSGLPNLNFSTALPEVTYDLVIVSHVVEHISDFTDVVRLFDLVAKGGLIYFEFPDPFRYEAFAQPQFAYYIDRLHINHFSQRSVLKLAPSHFEIVVGGGYPMPYSLGKAYPAQYVALRGRQGQKDIGNGLETYLRSEALQWANVHEQLRTQRFFVYGFGDNFHRALSAGGPLHSLESQIIGVIDRNARTLAARDQVPFRFIEPIEAAEIDGNLIVCTVSQFTNMAAFFKRAYPRSQIINV